MSKRRPETKTYMSMVCEFGACERPAVKYVYPVPGESPWFGKRGCAQCVREQEAILIEQGLLIPIDPGRKSYDWGPEAEKKIAEGPVVLSKRGNVHLRGTVLKILQESDEPVSIRVILAVFAQHCQWEMNKKNHRRLRKILYRLGKRGLVAKGPDHLYFSVIRKR